nr:peptidase M75 [Bacteroidales bacterium]
MKKSVLFVAGLMAFGTTFFTACGDDDDKNEEQEVPQEQLIDNEAVNVEYQAKYSKAWGNYMRVVATLLKTDSDNLYKDWNEAYEGGDSYAKRFKGAEGAGFKSAKDCVEQIVDGCVTIANEVGTAKIQEPVDKWKSGNTEEAVLAVESWFSWHSREDFANNIASVKNAYYGSLDGIVNDNSISKMIANNNADLDTEVKNAIDAAQKAILAIPQPFRNSLGSTEAQTAIEKCVELRDILTNKVKGIINGDLAEADWQPVL